MLANRLSRFAIGDRDSPTYNADGSLDLYFQSPDREAHWPPGPATGRLGSRLRPDVPRTQGLDGRRSPSASRRVEGAVESLPQ